MASPPGRCFQQQSGFVVLLRLSQLSGVGFVPQSFYISLTLQMSLSLLDCTLLCAAYRSFLTAFLVFCSFQKLKSCVDRVQIWMLLLHGLNWVVTPICPLFLRVRWRAGRQRHLCLSFSLTRTTVRPSALQEECSIFPLVLLPWGLKCWNSVVTC